MPTATIALGVGPYKIGCSHYGARRRRIQGGGVPGREDNPEGLQEASSDRDAYRIEPEGPEEVE
eukprot:2474524-Rhodomonas_salina.1